MNYFNWFLLLLTLSASSCNLPTLEEVDLNPEYAIPLLNDQITIEKILGNQNQVLVFEEANKQLTLRYTTELLSESIQDLLPSVTSIGEIEITDTLSYFPLSEGENFKITRAIFSGDQMRFRYSHNEDEDINIHMRIPELTKDGVVFEFDYTLESKGSVPFSEFTQLFDLDGYEFISAENRLTFQYDARNPEGERIKLFYAAMSFNELVFEYGEGSFERTRYLLNGDSLGVNVYEGWKKGMIAFEKPVIHFDLSHSYGFPISLKINEVSTINFNGESKFLSGMNVNQEIPLAFPSSSEVGTVETSRITFDENNSNINTLVNERVKFLEYDVEAIINPSGNLETIGFITDSSAFTLNINLDLPLSLKVTDLLISDTITLKNTLPELISEAEFKIVSQNTYPINIQLEIILLDENDKELERFFGDSPLVIEPTQEETRFVALDELQISKLKQAHKLVVEPFFDTSTLSDEFVQFLADQFLELRIGLKFKI